MASSLTEDTKMPEQSEGLPRGTEVHAPGGDIELF